MKDEDDLSEEDTEMNNELEEPHLNRGEKTKKQKMASAVILGLVIIGLFIAVYFVLELANFVQPTPKVFLSPTQYGFRQTNDRVYRSNKKRKISQQIQQLYKIVKIDQSSPQNLVSIEQMNMAHILYKKAMLKLDYQHLKTMVQSHSNELLTTQSQITSDQYLQAIKLLQFTTFSIADNSPDQIQLQKEEKERYIQKYGILQTKNTFQICLILLLSHKGLQYSDYFYALKSIFQQQYPNFNVIIINNIPQMNMDADIVNLVKEISNGRATILSKISQADQINEGQSVYYSLHKYCSSSDISIIMRDSGQLIGRQVFSLLNKFHIQKQAPLIFTNHLLQMGNSMAQLQDEYRYKVQIYPKLKDPLNVRQAPYKTKYLKSYSSKLLLSLPLNVFVGSEERRDNSLFEANLQFAALEVACGKYFLLEEILYKASRAELQTSLQIEQARNNQKMQCQNQGFQQSSKQNQQVIDINEIKNNLNP